MLFRQAGIFHTDYASDRALFPIAADRYMIAMLLLFGLVAPLLLNTLYLSSYLLPWLVWTARRTWPQPDSGLGGAIPPWLCCGDGNRRLCDGPCYQSRYPLGNRHHSWRTDGRNYWNRLCLCCTACQGLVPCPQHPAPCSLSWIGRVLRTSRNQRRHSGHSAGTGYPIAGLAHHFGRRLYYVALTWCIMVTSFMPTSGERPRPRSSRFAKRTMPPPSSA